MSDHDILDARDGLDVAIIGMAGRFPGAKTLDEFWRNLRDGVESIARFTDKEMEAFGVNAAALRDPNFVKAGALLEEIDLFDAAFFGYSPREAEVIDPQHRIFLECAWEALESAGYHPEKYDGMIGVYAGTSMSTYLLFNLLLVSMDAHDSFQAMIGNDKDFLSTRVSYDLNLKGPSIDVQTACSTSLVAVHLAYQSLLSYQCDVAIVGGISAQVPQRTGYYYQEGGISSPDGHCRAFDADAQGTIFGSGVGIVVLKRLADAIADADTIHAVIKGSAVNNDGSSKIGYTAPSVDGQAQVIALAQHFAGVEAETISYIEAHGTGTALGDPVEVAALTKAFRATTDKNNFCAIGSVKTNIGHLDAAAGVTGLIKTVLALKHKQLPPSLHFEKPNPKIEFENTPFFVNAKLSEWKAGSTPRRAGVSSFGIGGTNAHVIVEEAPPREASSKARPWKLLVLSAKTIGALDTASANLTAYLDRNREVDLADIAYTLQIGRSLFNYRRIAVCRDLDGAISALETLDPQRVYTSYQEPSNRPVVFMFPGGGAQYVNMGLNLYEEESVFRAHIDECSEILIRHLGYDLRDRLYPGAGESDKFSEQMKQTSLGLPSLFAVEYALARLWMSWGVRPQAMIGHSLGEYVAACLSGVFSLEEALSVVYLRARLFEKMPKGAMLSIPLSEREVRKMAGEGLSIAAINGPAQCVVSGTVAEIDDLAKLLDGEEIECRKLQIDVAAHSRMVEVILPEFMRFIENLDLRPPAIPFVSNVTGTWITADEATDPHYWGQHLRQTVRFADGLKELFKDPARILLETGPGQTLTTLAKLQPDASLERAVFASMRHPYDLQPDDAMLLTTLGKMWLASAEIDWASYYSDQIRHRIPLPTYPFQRQRYWIEAKQQSSAAAQPVTGKNPDISQWFYIPSWKRSLLKGTGKQQREVSRQGWIVMEDEQGIGARVASRLKKRGEEVVRVRAGERYERVSEEEYIIEAGSSKGYEEMMEELIREGKRIEVVMHLWSVEGEEGEKRVEERSGEYFKRQQQRGFYSLLFLAQALDKRNVTAPVKILVLSNNLHRITYDEKCIPEKSTLLGACVALPQEYPNITCKSIDFAIPEPGGSREAMLLDQLLQEAVTSTPDMIIAYRGDQRWSKTYEPVMLDGEDGLEGRLREKGVYLITGGLEGIGFTLAQHLAKEAQAKLVLIEHPRFPHRDEWEQWLDSQGDDDPISRKIQKARSLERSGAEVIVTSADTSESSQLRTAISAAVERFGALHGVIHAEAAPAEMTFRAARETSCAECDWHFGPKVYALYALEDALQDKKLDFCLIDSSLSSVLGGLGYTAYASANNFLDAFIQQHNKKHEQPWTCINWDAWRFDDEKQQLSNINADLARLAMTAEEGAQVFRRVLASNHSGQVIVSTGDLQTRLKQWVKVEPKQDRAGACDDKSGNDSSFHPRPGLPNAYVAPMTRYEQMIANVWQKALKIYPLGITDNFFDLGGDSLLAVQVSAELRKELNIEIPVISLYEGVTIKSLIEMLGLNRDDADSETRGETDEGMQDKALRRKQYQQKQRTRKRATIE